MFLKADHYITILKIIRLMPFQHFYEAFKNKQSLREINYICSLFLPGLVRVLLAGG